MFDYIIWLIPIAILGYFGYTLIFKAGFAKNYVNLYNQVGGMPTKLIVKAYLSLLMGYFKGLGKVIGRYMLLLGLYGFILYNVYVHVGFEPAIITGLAYALARISLLNSGINQKLAKIENLK